MANANEIFAVFTNISFWLHPLLEAKWKIKHIFPWPTSQFIYITYTFEEHVYTQPLIWSDESFRN